MSRRHDAIIAFTICLAAGTSWLTGAAVVRASVSLTQSRALIDNPYDPSASGTLLSPPGATSWSDSQSFTAQFPQCNPPGSATQSGTLSFTETRTGQEYGGVVVDTHVQGSSTVCGGAQEHAEYSAFFHVTVTTPYTITGRLKDNGDGIELAEVLLQGQGSLCCTKLVNDLSSVGGTSVNESGSLSPGDWSFSVSAGNASSTDQSFDVSATNITLVLGASGPRLSIGGALAQAGQPLLFPVTLSAPATQTVTVAYASGDGTARAGPDYLAANSTLSFSPGETSKQISIPTFAHPDAQSSKTLIVALASPVNATLGQDTATGTILYQAKVAITNLKVNQGVDAPDINSDGTPDIVTERPMVIRVSVSVAGLPDTQPVEVQVTFQGNTLPSKSPLVTTLLTNPIVDFFATPSSSAGQTTVTATIDPSNKLHATGSQSQKSLTVDAKPTQSLYVGYIEVDCKGPLSNYTTTVDQAGAFLLAEFPLAPTKLTNQVLRNPNDGSLLKHNCQFKEGPDAIVLWQEGKLASGGQANRVVGITTQQFMIDEGKTATTNGFAFCGDGAAFVVDGRWDSVAHELGHTLQLSHPFDAEADWCTLPPGKGSTDGYWVTLKQSFPGLTALMDYVSTAPTFATPSRWIASDDYARVFLEMLNNPADPEVLLVSGLLHQSGQVDFSPLYRIANGVVDSALPGPYAIRVLDAAGQVVYERTFDARLEVQTNPTAPLGDTAPFTFAVPYGPTATTVQVLKNGQVLAKTQVTGTLLRDAINSIPAADFTQNPDERRTALLNKVRALDAQLAAGDLTGARDNLRNDIRKQLSDWLVDGYPTTVLQYSKVQILGLVDELVQRLNG